MADRKILIIVEGRDNASGALSGVGGALGRIGEIAGGILSAQLFERLATGLMNLGREGLSAIADYERLGSTLQTLAARELVNTGKAADMASALEMAKGQAKELLDWTQKLAIKSPFTQQGVADAFKTALAYGFTVDQAKRLTQATIDFAAGSGAGQDAMGQIALALGQIQAKGKLSGQEILQLVNAGIPVTSILAKAFGKSTAEITKMVEQGLIPADAAIEAITKSLENDFGGAAERQSATWAGLMSTFDDIKQIGLREFFGGIAEALQPLAVQFSEWLQGPGLAKLHEWGTALGELAGGLISAVQGFDTSGISTMLGFVQSVVEKFQPGFTNLVAFWIQNGPAIQETIQNTFGKLVEIGGELYNNILPFLVDKFNLITGWFFTNGPLISDFIAVIGDAFVTVASVVADMWQFVAPLLSGLIDLILGLAQTVMQIATGDWNGAWMTIQQTAMNVLTALGSAATGFFNWIAGLMGSSLQNIVAIWSSNWEQFKQIVQQVLDIVVGIVNEKISAVASAFDGIVSAIQGAISWVHNLASAFASLAIPSWLTPGSPTPLENGLVGINKAMSKVADSTLPTFSAGFNSLIPNTPLANTNTSGAGAGAGAASGGSPVIQYVYSPTFSMADEREFYEKLVPFMDKHARSQD